MPDIERIAEIERQIESLIAKTFAAQRRGESTASMQRTLDQSARELAIIKTSKMADYGYR